jgi:hypothetical protein
MSKESTAFGFAIENLIAAGLTVDLRVNPSFGQNKSTGKVMTEDGLTVAKFSAGSFDEMAELLVGATLEAGDVTPSRGARSVLDYLRGIGSLARFVALDANGDLVNLPEFDTPIIHKQRAAAVRNGRANGAAVVLDLQTHEIAPIEAITKQGT